MKHELKKYIYIINVNFTEEIYFYNLFFNCVSVTLFVLIFT